MEYLKPYGLSLRQYVERRLNFLESAIIRKTYSYFLNVGPQHLISHTPHRKKHGNIRGNCVKDVEAVSRFVKVVKTVELCRAVDTLGYVEAVEAVD